MSEESVCSVYSVIYFRESSSPESPKSPSAATLPPAEDPLGAVAATEDGRIRGASKELESPPLERKASKDAVKPAHSRKDSKGALAKLVDSVTGRKESAEAVRSPSAPSLRKESKEMVSDKPKEPAKPGVDSETIIVSSRRKSTDAAKMLEDSEAESPSSPVEYIWKAHESGWAEVHLYFDSSDDTYRLLAWAANASRPSHTRKASEGISGASEKLILNCNISHYCSYEAGRKDFHIFTNEFGKVYGLGFSQDDVSIKRSQDLANLLETVIKSRKLTIAGKTPDYIPLVDAKEEVKIDESVPAVLRKYSSYLPSASKDPRLSALQPKGIPMGALNIGIPKPKKRGSITSAKPEGIAAKASAKVSEPISVTHDTHIVWDEKTQTFKGLPEEWQKALSKEPFGTPLKLVNMVYDSRYGTKIPMMLVRMREYLISNGALSLEGIFRVAPDGVESAVVRKQLEEGEFKTCRDLHCVANCLKLWFRKLPEPLLGVLEMSAFEACDSVESSASLVSSLPEPNKTLLIWLLDLCADFAENVSVNKMTPQNLAIVMAPNLFHLENVDPLQSLLLSQLVVQFMHHAIEWRKSLRT